MLLNPPQRLTLDNFACGYTLFRPSGTKPANPGRTGAMPRFLIAVTILRCRSSWILYHDGGRGPPHPRMFPILALNKKNSLGNCTKKKQKNLNLSGCHDCPVHFVLYCQESLLSAHHSVMITEINLKNCLFNTGFVFKKPNCNPFSQFYRLFYIFRKHLFWCIHRRTCNFLQGAR